MTTIKLTLTIDLDALVRNAVEQGIYYWAAKKSQRHPDGHWSVVDADDDKRYHLTIRYLRLALQTMSEKYPKLFGRIVSGNTDADTDDALVQVACFGELKYG